MFKNDLLNYSSFYGRPYELSTVGVFVELLPQITVCINVFINSFKY